MRDRLGIIPAQQWPLDHPLIPAMYRAAGYAWPGVARCKSGAVDLGSGCAHFSTKSHT